MCAHYGKLPDEVARLSLYQLYVVVEGMDEKTVRSSIAPEGAVQMTPRQQRKFVRKVSGR